MTDGPSQLTMERYTEISKNRYILAHKYVTDVVLVFHDNVHNVFYTSVSLFEFSLLQFQALLPVEHCQGTETIVNCRL